MKVEYRVKDARRRMRNRRRRCQGNFNVIFFTFPLKRVIQNNASKQTKIM